MSRHWSRRRGGRGDYVRGGAGGGWRRTVLSLAWASAAALALRVPASACGGRRLRAYRPRQSPRSAGRPGRFSARSRGRRQPGLRISGGTLWAGPATVYSGRSAGPASSADGATPSSGGRRRAGAGWVEQPSRRGDRAAAYALTRERGASVPFCEAICSSARAIDGALFCPGRARAALGLRRDLTGARPALGRYLPAWLPHSAAARCRGALIVPPSRCRHRRSAGPCSRMTIAGTFLLATRDHLEGTGARSLRMLWPLWASRSRGDPLLPPHASVVERCGLGYPSARAARSSSIVMLAARASRRRRR